MVPDDQVLLALQTLQHPLKLPHVRTLEEQVAQDIDGVALPHALIPVPNHRLVHLLHRAERPLAQRDDVRVEEMRVSNEIEH